MKTINTIPSEWPFRDTAGFEDKEQEQIDSWIRRHGTLDTSLSPNDANNLGADIYDYPFYD